MGLTNQVRPRTIPRPASAPLEAQRYGPAFLITSKMSERAAREGLLVLMPTVTMYFGVPAHISRSTVIGRSGCVGCGERSDRSGPHGQAISEGGRPMRSSPLDALTQSSCAVNGDS